MKNVLLAGVVACAMAVPASAGDFYFRGGLGVTLNPEANGLSLGDGRILSGALGFATERGLRFDVSVDRINQDLSWGKQADGQAYMVNGYYDFDFLGDNISPFVGAGYGIAEAEISGGGWSLDGDGRIGQLEGGVSFPLGYFTGQVSVKHYDADLDFQGYDLDFSGQAVTLGGRVNF